VHHQAQVVLDELIPRGQVARGVGQQVSLLLLGAQRGREGAGTAQVQREKQELPGEGLHQHVQHIISLSFGANTNPLQEALRIMLCKNHIS